MIQQHPCWPVTLTPWQRVADGGYAPEIDALLDVIDHVTERERALVDELIETERSLRLACDVIEGLREREEARRRDATTPTT